MRYYLILLSIMTISCSKEDKICYKHTLEYLPILSDSDIANNASADMYEKCGGEYNLISREERDKRIIYTFSCPSQC